MFTVILIGFSLRDGVSHSERVQSTNFFCHADVSLPRVEGLVRGVVPYEAGSLEVEDALMR